MVVLFVWCWWCCVGLICVRFGCLICFVWWLFFCEFGLIWCRLLCCGYEVVGCCVWFFYVCVDVVG